MDLMTYALCKGNGGGSGGDNRFIVTLTPTAQDFSGTMDKTPQEINAAYEAGQDIWFMINTSANFSYLIRTTFIGKPLDEEYMSFGAVFNYNSEYEIEFYTNSEESTYSTSLYPLTPVS